MPAVTGVELARQIKVEYPDLPVIVLSGLNEVPAGADLADAFLSKLEGPEKLCRETEGLLKAQGLIPPHNSHEH